MRATFIASLRHAFILTCFINFILSFFFPSFFFFFFPSFLRTSTAVSSICTRARLSFLTTTLLSEYDQCASQTLKAKIARL